MLTLWLSRLNPYSNGSYFLTIMTRKQFSKEQHRLNPYSNGSYFLTWLKTKQQTLRTAS